VLVEAGIEIEAVVTKADRIKGRGQKTEATEVKKYAQELNSSVIAASEPQSSNDTGSPRLWVKPAMTTSVTKKIKILEPENLKEFAHTPEFNNLKSDYAVLVSYGKIIPQIIIDKFKAIINIHPSMLPDLRGPSPVQTTMMRGDTDFAISIMKLEAGMDSGPVYDQFPVGLHGTKPGYRDTLNTLVEVGARKLCNLLPQITSGELLPKDQDESKATYCKMITKDDAKLDFNQQAELVAAKINALSEWPKCKITLHEVENVALLEAAAVETPGRKLAPDETVIGHDGTLLIGCGDGAIAIDILQVPGGRPMTSKDFWNGIKSKLD
jgi:methionyl-tRNA formyltransferase